MRLFALDGQFFVTKAAMAASSKNQMIPDANPGEPLIRFASSPAHRIGPVIGPDADEDGDQTPVTEPGSAEDRDNGAGILTRMRRCRSLSMTSTNCRNR